MIKPVNTTLATFEIGSGTQGDFDAYNRFYEERRTRFEEKNGNRSKQIIHMNAAEWTKQEYARLSRKIDMEHLPPQEKRVVHFQILKIEKLTPVPKTKPATA